MPGPSSGVPMNSIPAASRVFFISINVEERLGGTPSACSNLWIVGTLTPDASDNCEADHFREERAALIWIPVINLTSLMIYYISLKTFIGKISTYATIKQKSLH